MKAPETTPTWFLFGVGAGRATANDKAHQLLNAAVKNACKISDGKAEDVFQHNMFSALTSKGLPAWLCDEHSTVVVDTHSNRFLGGLAPDIVVTSTGCESCLCPTVTRSIIELRESTVSISSNTMLGQVAQYACRILTERPVQIVDVMACTPKKVVFYRVHKTEGSGELPSSIVRTTELDWAVVFKEDLLSTFLLIPDALVAANSVLATADYAIRGFLGRGVSANVFVCERLGAVVPSKPAAKYTPTSNTFAVKVARPGYDLAAEEQVCRTVSRALLALRDEGVDVGAVLCCHGHRADPVGGPRSQPTRGIVDVGGGGSSSDPPGRAGARVRSSARAGAGRVPMLLFQPIGERFDVRKAPLLKRHICQGLRALSCIHHAGFVLRDPRPANLLLVGAKAPSAGGDLLMIDMGTAIGVQQIHPFEGTVRFASTAVLTALQSGTALEYTPKDDLHAFVRACAVLVAPWLDDELRLAFSATDVELMLQPQQLRRLVDFWEFHLGLADGVQETVWTELDRAIDALPDGANYDGLCKLVQWFDRYSPGPGGKSPSWPEARGIYSLAPAEYPAATFATTRTDSDVPVTALAGFGVVPITYVRARWQCGPGRTQAGSRSRSSSTARAPCWFSHGRKTIRHRQRRFHACQCW